MLFRSKEEKVLATFEDFESYYHHIVEWWSAMDNVFYIPDLDVPQAVRDEALKQRAAVETYSDAMDRLCVEFWRRKFPQHADIAFVVSPYEVIDAGKNGMGEAQAAEIRKRLAGFGLYNGKLYLLDELSRIMKGKATLETVVAEGVKEFKGNTACPGYGKGIVRLVLLKSQVAELRDGEVLVTEMTNPDFLPAMKKACAIVTDEGGLTCHAAIVSREMKKPCVIGTKIATKVLKDGDEVEVDAEKGIVRILKRA